MIRLTPRQELIRDALSKDRTIKQSADLLGIEVATLRNAMSELRAKGCLIAVKPDFTAGSTAREPDAVLESLTNKERADYLTYLRHDYTRDQALALIRPPKRRRLTATPPQERQA
jgi:hypothetical protein